MFYLKFMQHPSSFIIGLYKLVGHLLLILGPGLRPARM